MAHRGPVQGRSRRTGASSFLRSRLRAPANPEHYLRRPRLLELLDDSAAAPITLVVAPAGSGKTSLLVDWCSASSVPTAWLSLDDTDRDGSQFWTAMAAVLAELTDRPRHPSPRAGSLNEVAESLLADLEAEHPDHAVLILDDVHIVDQDEAVVTSLEHFVRSLPTWLHVVLLSRRTPQLPIDRLRARGHLAEIHFAELRFSAEEAGEMLVRLAPSLTQEAVETAVGRAGGWAAGLQLTALVARSERAQGAMATPLGESDILLSDYVWHEVLEAERPDLVDVLLQTCVVNRINPELATALTGRRDAEALLLEAESRGLFISRLGRSGWLEMHALVREELEAEASRRSPQQVADQHARAASWFEDAGELTSALEHWLCAGLFREALRLLAVHVADLYDSGREATLTRTMARIPLNVATADVESMLEFAWCQLLVDRDRFLETVRQAGAMTERVPEPGPVVLGRLRMLESLAALVTGDWSRAGRLAAAASALLGGDGTPDPLGRFGWNVVARDVALSESWDDGSPRLEEARLALSGDAERRIAYEGTRALGEALAGHPVDALRIAAGVRDVTAVGAMTLLRAELDVAEAVSHRELGDRPRAVAELTALGGTDQWPAVHAQAIALLELTQLRLDEGDLDAADRAFEQAHELISRDHPGPGGLGWLGRTGTVVALSAGYVEAAHSWSEQIEDPFWRGVSIARVRLFEGRPADAAAALAGATPRCTRHEVVRALLQARSAEAHQEALGHAVRAVECATGAGLLQTVASEGAPVFELIEVAASLAPAAWLDRLRTAVPPRATDGFADPSLPGEHLTERELEVLRVLPSRLTLREIAGELFISVNTLKFHLRVIYRKLGVGSREEAAAVARHMTGLPRPPRGSEPAPRTAPGRR